MQKLKAHPDLGGEEWNAAIINEAYRVLMDTEKRNEYDVSLFRGKSLGTLGKQHHNQRKNTSVARTYDDWKPFKATVVDNS